MKALIKTVVDQKSFMEVAKYWAKNMITGFARMGGMAVGIVANNPMFFGRVPGHRRLAQMRPFRAFLATPSTIPVLTFVDVPGFLPGIHQEYGGIICHGSKVIYAYCEATVPLITVITRKAYGGAYDVMGSKHHGADLNFAYPTAEIAVMGPEGAVNIIFRKELGQAEDKAAAYQELLENYRSTVASPYRAAELGYIDEIILPQKTRPKIIRALKALQNKRALRPKRRHGNIPL